MLSVPDDVGDVGCHLGKHGDGGDSLHPGADVPHLPDIKGVIKDGDGGDSLHPGAYVPHLPDIKGGY